MYAQHPRAVLPQSVQDLNETGEGGKSERAKAREQRMKIEETANAKVDLILRNSWRSMFDIHPPSIGIFRLPFSLIIISYLNI